MRKHVIGQEGPADRKWFDLEKLAQVEISSEDPAHPIECALKDGGRGWLASIHGEQVIRLLFDEPARLRSIDVRFDEHGAQRTQEFVLRWSPDKGRSYREIVRQRYTFSPPGTTCESEHYAVNIDGLTVLELRVIPDIGGGSARASLTHLRVA